MYTGIVDHCGRVIDVQLGERCLTLWIQTTFSHFSLGESIAVDGICLTVTDSREDAFACELSPETLRLTAADRYVVGTQVNLERSMLLQDRVGGHFVSGHIDQAVVLEKIQSHGEFQEMIFSGVDSDKQKYLSEKGSIAINGVSLTINRVMGDAFSVMLIPHTLSRTNLSSLKENDIVNIEFDQLAKLVSRQLSVVSKPSDRVSRVEKAVRDLAAGKMVIVVDNEDRENEGDLVLGADFATPENINWMLKQGGGLLCAPMSAEKFDQLQIPMMNDKNESHFETPFGVGIGAREGITSGISAEDRAYTIKTVANAQCTREDIVIPGHVFPLRANAGGVMKRDGHTEASIELMQLAGLAPVAVLSEVMNEDGTMARRDALDAMADKFGLTLISIAELKEYLHAQDNPIKEVASSTLPVKGKGEFLIRVFKNTLTDKDIVVLQKGDLYQPILVRLHSSCLTGDILGSQRCDCGEQLDLALDRMAKEGGALLYLDQEGRDIGLANKIKAYALQDRGMDTVQANHQLGFQADLRDYMDAAAVLKAMGVTDIRLMSNNPRKVLQLENHGVHVVERVALQIDANDNNAQYLETKKKCLGHLL